MIRSLKFDMAPLDRAKWAFTTRRVNRADIVGLHTRFTEAIAGDLVLCEILHLGQHKKIQLAERRPSEAYIGDLAVLCLGDRYAPDQFHASAVLDGGPAHLVAGGGIVGRVDMAHQAMEDPTMVRPLGLLADAEGRTVNVARYALPPLPMDQRPTVIGVFGASMNAGKTTAAASLAHGLSRAGHATVALKATGTGAFSDFNTYEDAGVVAMDFTDAGMATTYRMPMERIEQGFATLVATAAANGADVIVVEIADGVFQPETRAILDRSPIGERLDGILFATPDALGAVGGVAVLGRYGRAPFAISGKVSCSPLAAAEAHEATGLPILSREDLCTPAVIEALVAPLIRGATRQTAA